MGTLSGTAEVLGETLSLENIKGLQAGETKGLLRDILRSAGIEGSEEGATTLLNTFADNIVNGNESDYYVALEGYISQGMSYADAERAAMKDWVNGIAFDMISGAASGGISGGVGGPVARAGNYLAEKFQAGDGQKNTVPSQETESTAINDNPRDHTAEEQQKIEEYKAAVDENLVNYIETVKENPGAKIGRYTLRPVNDRAATDIKAITGVDVSGNKTAIEPRIIEHIIKDHGPQGRTDQSMSDINDIARIQYVLDNYDSVEYGGKSAAYQTVKPNGKPGQAKTVVFQKAVNGTYYAVEAVPDTKAKTVFVVSAYMSNKKTGDVQTADADASRVTSETKNAQSPNTSIPTGAQNVKEESAYLARNAAAFGPAANDVYNLYSPTQTAREYIAAMDAAINTVAANVSSWTAFQKADSVQYLTKEQKEFAWSQGQQKRTQAQEKDGGKKTKPKKKTPTRTGRVSYGGVSYEGRTFKATSEDKVKPEARRVLEKFAAATGVDIVFYESEADQRGDYVGANGFYRNGTVYLDVHAGAKNTTEKEAVLVTAAHEFTHFIRENTPRRYNQLKEFVTEHLLENGYDFETLVERKIKAAQKEGGLSRDAAVEEVVADACEMVFSSSKAVERLAKEKPGLAKRIADWLHEFFSDIRKAFEGVEARHEEAKAMLDAMDELTKLWDDALVEAVENRGDGYIGEIARKGSNRASTKFQLREYSPQQIENWSNSKRIVVYTGEQQLRKFIASARDNKAENKKMYFGMVPATMAKAILDSTGLDVEGFNCSISAYEIRKIFKDHGNQSKEEQRGQRAITEDDIVSIPDILLNADRIELSPKLYNGKPAISFVKQGNDRVTVTAYVSDKHLDLVVQTMFANIKKGNLATPTDVQASVNTPEANHGTVSNNSIRTSEPNVKKSRRENDEEDLRIKYPHLNLNEDISDLDGIPAIELADGSVLPIKDHDRYPTHVSFIEENRIDVDDLRSGGWIGNGVYDPSFTSDTARYIERQQARKRVAELTGKPFQQFRYSRRDSAEGLTKEEARAQAASYTRLKAENAELQRRVEYWKGQTQRTKQATVRQADVNRFARALIKNYSSTADQTYIRQALQEMGDYLVQNDGDSLDYEQLRQMAVTVSAELVATSEVTEEDGYTADVADDILSSIRNADIKLDRQYFKDLPEGFRKAFRGKLHIFTDKGRSVDSIYAELQETFGYDLFPAIDNPADQVVMMGDIFDRLNTPAEVNPRPPRGGRRVRYG